ncbi:MAG TPA: YdiU family protein [Candidatus Poseidoniales archaeon]|nr:MAG: YdiU family protein [Euryarchaeota archaeon]HIF46355.1 YdiU family protein [Candidatus Poseidoniales archaeon]HIL64973.1 YdiU family protein [Candidatus Poseidoniales archaeon]
MKGLADLDWLSRFLHETPGDPVEGGPTRQVLNACWSRVNPTPIPVPRIIAWSDQMAQTLGLDQRDPSLLAGNQICDGMEPYSQCYGGHQFGTWAGQLGDGRAITLGEVKADKSVLELQLKGAGRTPYSRHADGKAVLRSSVREFLCSEAMFHLGVPTTRALSLCTTGENIVRDMFYDGRPAEEPGAVVCRVAPSFLRFGSFQIHAMRGDESTLRSLVEHTLKTHFPHLKSQGDQLLIDWLSEVGQTTAHMVIEWLRVGFVHGVMNSDNMSIHGLTIDYGPYGWIEGYDHNWTPNTTDLQNRRYRFGQQPMVAGWNLSRLFEAISPLLKNTQRLQKCLESYDEILLGYYHQMWCDKLGLNQYNKEMVEELIGLFHSSETDMTIFFRLLATVEKPNIGDLKICFYDFNSALKEEWTQWLSKYLALVKPNRAQAMNRVNPKYVLRNWMAQLAIDKAEQEDFTLIEELYQLLKKPYDEQPEMESKWFVKRPEWARNRPGCSMLSCSS